MKNLFGLFALLAVGVTAASADEGALFLKTNPDARYSSLGNAGSAYAAESAASVFSNPAGLASMTNKEMMFSHTDADLNNTFESLSYAFRSRTRLFSA